MNIRRINFFLITAVSIIVARQILSKALFRDLWFDEALTFLNFALLPDVAAIYKNYVIPNNQILFTVLLKYWNQYSPGLLMPDFHMRLLPLIFAVSSLAVIYSWRRYFSRRAVLLTAAALAISLPFEIYAVALRAYMLSLFLLLVCVGIAFKIRSSPKRMHWYAAYFFMALAAVAALPSNIVALGGIAIWFIPIESKKKWPPIAWWMLALLPLLAMGLFYLPLAKQIRGILALREGWNNHIQAAVVFYSAFLLSFLPLLLTARSATITFWLKTVAVLLLPMPFFLLRTPAPFPRVFFPYWAVMLLPAISLLNTFLAQKRRSPSAYPLLCAAVVCGAAGMFSIRSGLSDFFTAGYGMDDYFYPSYARPEFQPHTTVKMLREKYGNSLPDTYVSFNADFYPLIFYGLLNNISSEVWKFDGPRSKVDKLKPGTLVVLSNHDDELENFIARFKTSPHRVFDNGFHQVYRLREQPQNIER
ncbi:MAG: hypothetical protein GX280_06110 [Lentisphaerae bacterium]|jgi:hypothetical protein|nr:hypothetical protein [Victivallaceae bacterium]NLK83638.1 hypothetical protein [Lentisphaerota bacterium]